MSDLGGERPERTGDGTTDRAAADRPGGQPRDYYDPGFGRFVTENLGTEPGAELWDRQLPLMRVYGLVVLSMAAVSGVSRLLDGEAWRLATGVAAIAALLAVFWLIWIRRAIWAYTPRTLAIHGAFQLVTYALLVSLTPAFAVLQLIVYPQIVFSLPVRWSVLGTLFVGAFTGAAIVWQSPGDPGAAVPWLFYNLLIAVLVVAIGVWMRLTIAQSMERRALIAELTSTRRELAAAEREAAVAEERGRLAREIHDTLAQGFASVVTRLEAAEAYLGTDEARVREDFEAAQEVARSSLAEARTLVWALRPETIATAGLPGAIQRVATAGGAAAGPPFVEVAISGTSRTLHPEVEVTLLRAAQEAVANARRHAGAARITVTLTYFRDQVTLDVADDGCGFDPEACRPGGMGLLGMRERAEKLGGTVEIESGPGEGTTVVVTLPAIEPPAAARPSAPADPTKVEALA